MLMFSLKRVGVSFLALLGISVALFAMTRAIPGDPVSMYLDPMTFTGDREAALAEIRAQMGFDQPLPVQYWNWLVSALQGNLGFSVQTGRPVGELMLSRLGATAYLMLIATVTGILIGVWSGIYAALRKNTIADYAILLGGLVLTSVPNFFLAFIGIYFFGLRWKLLPTAGMNTPDGGFLDAVAHLVMPATLLAVGTAVGYIRWARSSMLDVLDQDYLVTARSKGLSARRVTYRHGLRNALIPLVTIVTMSIPHLFGGAVIIEQLFAWPGTGRMAVDAITNRDYPVLMGFVMLTAILVLLCNLVADILYAVIDPRIRL